MLPSPPILLVEDDDNDCYLMQRAFTAAQVDNPLIFAHNGDEAMHLLTGPSPFTPQPCVLITDIKMPKVDGFELLIWLRTQPRLQAMPKLVISSSVLEEDLAKSLQLGATAYFIKPHGLAALIRLVRYWKEAFFQQVVCAHAH